MHFTRLRLIEGEWPNLTQPGRRLPVLLRWPKAGGTVRERFPQVLKLHLTVGMLI